MLAARVLCDHNSIHIMRTKQLFVAALVGITTFSACKKEEVEKAFATLFSNGAVTVSACSELSGLT